MVKYVLNLFKIKPTQAKIQSPRQTKYAIWNQE